MMSVPKAYSETAESRTFDRLDWVLSASSSVSSAGSEVLLPFLGYLPVSERISWKDYQEKSVRLKELLESGELSGDAYYDQMTILSRQYQRSQISFFGSRRSHRPVDVRGIDLTVGRIKPMNAGNDSSHG